MLAYDYAKMEPVQEYWFRIISFVWTNVWNMSKGGQNCIICDMFSLSKSI